MFDRLIWKHDRVVLDDLVFRFGFYTDDQWELGGECFEFYKDKDLVDQYARLFAERPAFRAENVFELGIWRGGSVAFWSEILKPVKHVAVDLTTHGDSDYFQRYMKSGDLEGRIKTCWGVDQADGDKLREIVAQEFHGPLDLVIDDASHLYGPTRSSFETLFPLLRPGGLYIIEDWAWHHDKEYQTPDHPWALETPVTRLVFDLVEATGSSLTFIPAMRLSRGLTMVERGEMTPQELQDFRLDDHIVRRPSPPLSRRLMARGRGLKAVVPAPARRFLRRLLRRG